MRAFDASDVLYNARVHAVHARRRCGTRTGGQTIPPSQFLREISWVSPQYVAAKLGKQLSGAESGDGGSTDENQTTGPGLHGTGLNATVYGGVTLSAAASNRLTYVKGQAFPVSFTNQGDNDEFNVKVTLKIARASGRLADHAQQDRAADRQGREGDRRAPAQPRTPAGRDRERSSVTVAAVPGEKKTDNNKSTYPTLFVRASLSSVSDFSEAPGIVALAAAAAALIALIWLLVLSFRFRRVRSAQKAVLGEHGQTRPGGARERPAARVRGAARPRRGRRRAPGRADGGGRGPARRGDRLPRRSSATTPTARCPATSRRRSRCSTPITMASCSPRSPTATPPACTASRSTPGSGEHQLSPEEEEAVRLALAGGEVRSVILESQ